MSALTGPPGSAPPNPPAAPPLVAPTTRSSFFLSILTTIRMRCYNAVPESSLVRARSPGPLRCGKHLTGHSERHCVRPVPGAGRGMCKQVRLASTPWYLEQEQHRREPRSGWVTFSWGRNRATVSARCALACSATSRDLGPTTADDRHAHGGCPRSASCHPGGTRRRCQHRLFVIR